MKKIKKDIEVNGLHIEKLLIIFIYRVGNYIFYSNIPELIKKTLLCILNIIRKIFIVLIFHVEIPFKCKIGAGLKLMHPHSIILHPCVQLGENCTLFHGITIGSNEKGDVNNVAIIGDNVYIGTGAKIIGGVIIESNCKIGANSVVVKNMKKNQTIICRCEII
ncbi:serine acetyltransferase [Paraclostridium bifermentans]|uniref:serine acetyltransferase n=1 Tax=Paraclostridium bifermentans TaxID=1490 RepID=UPI00135F1AEF|nr:serine acetyltransferase [Paraclostridium bifermentans]